MQGYVGTTLQPGLGFKALVLNYSIFLLALPAAPTVCERLGKATSTFLDYFSRGSPTPHTCRMLRSTWVPPHTDRMLIWCLEIDVVANLGTHRAHLQVTSSR